MLANSTIQSLFTSQVNSNQVTQINRVIILRLFILSLTTAFLIGFHFAYKPLEFSSAIALVISLAFAWSVYALNSESYLSKKHTLVLEIAIDFAWVLVLVLLSGRSANPFIYYFLLLTAIAAATLNNRQAWSFCLLGIVIYSTLLLLDVSEHFEHFADNYKTHLAGMWFNYVASAAVACFFISQQTRLLKDQQEQLAEERETNLKNEQLIGIATISANTLHNLSTPISTLSVITEELLDQQNLDKEIKDDALLMQEQIIRCQQSMAELSLLAEQGSKKQTSTISDLINFLKLHYSLNSPSLLPLFVEFDEEEGISSRHINSSVLVQYAIINLINNSIQSGIHAPEITIEKNVDAVMLHIKNHSTLNAEDIIQRWGKPTQSNKTAGMGIGSFLANSTIEQQGGSVTIETRATKQNQEATTIIVTVCLPVEQIATEVNS